MTLGIDRNQTTALETPVVHGKSFIWSAVYVCVCMLRRDSASAFLSLIQCLFSPLAAFQDNLEQSTGYPWIKNTNMGSEVWCVYCDQQSKIKITNQHFLYKVIGCSKKGMLMYNKMYKTTIKTSIKGRKDVQMNLRYALHLSSRIWNYIYCFTGSFQPCRLFVSSVKMTARNIVRNLSRSIFKTSWTSAGENPQSLMYQFVEKLVTQDAFLKYIFFKYR